MTAFEETIKKYNLPTFILLDKYFDLAGIEEKEITIRDVRKKIGEKIGTYAELCSRVIHPDPGSYADLYECNCFSTKEKEKISAVIKTLMVLHRKLLITELENDEKNDAEFIKTTTEEWKPIIEQIRTMLQKLKEEWTHNGSATKNQNYFV